MLGYKHLQPKAKQEHAPDFDLIQRFECEDSLASFTEKQWRYIDPAPFKRNWVFDAIAEHLEAVTRGHIRRLLINVPPRFGKSSLVSVAWPAWTWAQQINSPTSGPVAQFVYTSYSGVFSQRDSMKTRRLVASPTYQKYWGDKVLITKDQDAKSRFETTAGGYRIATSVGGTLTGDGGNILCFPKGTRVTTPSGDLAIEDFVPGDEVVAFDISQGKVVTSTVLSTRSLLAHEFITICTSKGRSFRCTPEHRIFVPGRGYICASELVVGERLIGVSDIKEGASQDQMQPMSVSYAETLVRRSQSSETERYGSLLLDSVQEQTSFIQELKGVPRVFGGREWGSSAQLNLLQGMPSDRSGKTSKERRELRIKLCPECLRRFSKNTTFCSRQCADENHARNMLGATNSNFGAEWIYSELFQKLKALVKERDQFSCVACSVKESFIIDKKKRRRSNLSVHHIDEDTRNDSITNLVTLCARCHKRHHHGQLISSRPLRAIAVENSLSMTSGLRALIISLQKEHLFITA